MATSFTTHSAGQTILSADINLIQTAVNALENVPPNFAPADQGFLGWSLDPHVPDGSGTVATGTGRAALIRLPACTVTNLYCYATTSAALTNAFMALYTSAGVFVAQSTNLGTAGTSSFTGIGLKTFPLSPATAVSAGLYYAFFWGSSTTASLAAHATTSGDVKVGSAVTRTGTAGSALTTTAPSPLGAVTFSTAVPWLAAA